MKITVDMTQIHAAPELGRVAAVALLCALPRDEAELAVDEWRAVLRVRDADVEFEINLAEGAEVEAFIGAAMARETDPTNATLEGALLATEAGTVVAAPVTPPAAAAPAKFAYGGRTFSARKGGPAAAYRQALEDVAACETIRDLDDLINDQGCLMDTFVAVGHPDRVDGLREAVDRRRAGLIEPVLVEPVVAEPEPPLVIENIEDTIPLPEPRVIARERAAANGSTDPVHAMSLRELCRFAEHEVGRDAVIEAMKRCGVSKLAGLEAGAEAALRAAVMGLLQ